jgi:RNA polymerase sigma factor (TIGR02999 family)
MRVGKDTASREVSRILRAADGGEDVEMDALLPLVYDQLKAIAARKMATERPDHTLSATALVHEAYLKLVGLQRLAWSSKAHFYVAAAESMRRILVDHARAKGTAKRGGGCRILPLDVVDLATREDPPEIVAIEEALSRLEEEEPRLAEVVKLRFFAGLDVSDIAPMLGLAERTVRRDWYLARAWLGRELSKR